MNGAPSRAGKARAGGLLRALAAAGVLLALGAVAVSTGPDPVVRSRDGERATPRGPGGGTHAAAGATAARAPTRGRSARPEPDAAVAATGRRRSRTKRAARTHARRAEPAGSGSRSRRRTGPLPPRRSTAPAVEAPLVIGVAYQDAARINAYYRSFGGKAEAADPAAQVRAVAEHLNRTGGIGGRTVELRLRRYDTTGGRRSDLIAGELCAAFASGPRPAVVLAAAGAWSLGSCLARHGLPHLSDWPTSEGDAEVRRDGAERFLPGSLAVDRFAAPYVRELAAAGFFRDARVGLLVYAHPTLGGAAAELRRELGAAGVQPAADVAIATVHDWSDLATALAEISGAVLRFKLERIDRILSVDVSGQIIGLFMRAAEPAGYRPRYGLSTLNAPLDLGLSLPAAQLRGAIGIGWSPLVDVPAAEEGDLPPDRLECAEIYERAGVPTGTRTANGQYTAYAFCGQLLLLREALRRPAASVRIALERLGAGHTSALSFSTRLDAARHDGVAGYRALWFDDGCACFRYSGPVRTLP